MRGIQHGENTVMCTRFRWGGVGAIGIVSPTADSAENATPPKTTKARNSISWVQTQIKLKSQFATHTLTQSRVRTHTYTALPSVHDDLFARVT